MKKFNKKFRGYDTNEVNLFLDNIIKQTEDMVNQLKTKDNQILELQQIINKYKNLEHTINTSILSAQDNAERIRDLAKQESNNILLEARRNANKIISDSLSRAERVQYNVELFKKNITLYKKRVRTMLEQQLELMDELDTNEL